MIGLFISIYNIAIWKLQSDKTRNQVDKIQKITDIEELDDNDNTSVIETEELSKSNPYWD